MSDADLFGPAGLSAPGGNSVDMDDALFGGSGPSLPASTNDIGSFHEPMHSLSTPAGASSANQASHSIQFSELGGNSEWAGAILPGRNAGTATQQGAPPGGEMPQRRANSSSGARLIGGFGGSRLCEACGSNAVQDN